MMILEQEGGLPKGYTAARAAPRGTRGGTPRGMMHTRGGMSGRGGSMMGGGMHRGGGMQMRGKKIHLQLVILKIIMEAKMWN